MKIKTLKFTDKSTQWKLSKTVFDDLTLLVGASGVGKTQILMSILKIRSIAKGKSRNGASWDIEFSISPKSKYRWTGEFNIVDESKFSLNRDDSNSNKPVLLSEKITLNKKVIASRTSKRITFNGKKTPLLSSNDSLVYLFKEEKIIAPIFQEFQDILYSDQSDSKERPNRFNGDLMEIASKLSKYKSLEDIRNSNLNIETKLFLALHNCKKMAKTIKDRYINIFPFVEDIKYSPLDHKLTPSIMKDIPFIQIKEKGVEDWIISSSISSGMYRTLMHLSELYLCPENSVILIDEFENSLGINCIDELTMDLLTSNDRNIQFILTSHHPYIINKINFNNWQIVTRKGSVVTTRNANKVLNFSGSRQKAFTILTQSEEFNTGQTEV